MSRQCRKLLWMCPGRVQPRGSCGKFSSLPFEKRMANVSEAAPANVPPWMQQPWPSATSSQQQQWMMARAAPWMNCQPPQWMMGQQFPAPWLQTQQAPVAQPN